MTDGETGRPQEDPNQPAGVQVEVYRPDTAAHADSTTQSLVERLEAEEGVSKVQIVSRGASIEVRVEGALSEPELLRTLDEWGYELRDQGAVRTRFDVPEMDCPSCATTVGRALERVDGIEEIETQPTTGTVVVGHGETASPEGIREAIEQAGYPVTNIRSDSGQSSSVSAREPVWQSRRALETAFAAVVLLLGLALEFVAPALNIPVWAGGGLELHLADVSFLIAVAVGGHEILQGGYRSAQVPTLDIDFLMSVAIVGALVASLVFAESLYFEAATLAVLFSIAELLEQQSMAEARNSLQELMNLSPDRARVRRNDGVETIPVADVMVGDIVLVRPGEKIPRDGTVVEGETAVDQSPVTGESIPAEKRAGDEVFAGTINEAGYIEVEVEDERGADTLSRVIRMVEDAQSKKTERERFVERFSSYYTPVVVGFAILTTLAAPSVLGVGWQTAVVYGLTLLVLACPCAFVISTPVSVVSGVTSAAKHGVLIKGGNHLEAMGTVDVVAFDKTGTLTGGELSVTDVIPLNGYTEAQLLRHATALERRSEHPIATAIREAAPDGDQSVPDVDEFESITGKGIRARLDGTLHLIGKPELFDERGFELSHTHATTDGGVVTGVEGGECPEDGCLDLQEETVPRLQQEGKTVVLLGTDEELFGVIALADEVRSDAKATISRLRELGVTRTVLLTGDNERTAAAIADQVGVDSYQADLLPDEKVAAVEDLQAAYGDVAMVGDGINDAPALATATVGIAMGAAGTDTALETADIALMADDLSRLPYLYELAGDANQVIRQNIWASLGVKAALALAVPFGYVPIWLAVLAGDAGMTVGVTGNAMRLSRVNPVWRSE